MNDDRLEVDLPAGLQVVPGMRPVFAVEIVGDRYSPRDWSRRWRIQGLGESGGDLVGEFHGSMASMQLPKDVAGTVTLRFELEHRRTGRGLHGTMRLRVNLHQGSGPINIYANHKAEGMGQVYTPIEVTSTGGGEVRLVEGDQRVVIPLQEERGLDEWHVPLSSVLKRTKDIPIPDRSDGVLRMMSLAVGPRTLLGRLYGFQLREEAARLMADLRHDRVHWVTCWDDDSLNSISAELAFARRSLDELALTVRNVTGYSRMKRPLFAAADGVPEVEVAAGEQGELAFGESATLELHAHRGSARKQMLRLEYREVAFGGSAIPVLTSSGTVFHWFPEWGPPQGFAVKLLGLWIPMDLHEFQHLLEPGGHRFWVSFEDDGIDLRLFKRRSGIVVVNSNVDLRPGLAQG